MKQLGLFGDEAMMPQVKRTKAEVFEDYDAFVAKFYKKAPKTTDDCYTPQPVYEAVVNWVKEHVDLEGRCIIRPFYPGGDYEREEYPENCVVIDNPPFSILSKIVDFYRAAKVDFFLFAPALTLLSCAREGVCYLVANADIVYANGAAVLTGFCSNLFPGTRIMLAGSLKRAIDAVNVKQPSKATAKMIVPPCVVTGATLGKYVRNAYDLSIPDDESHFVKWLDSMHRVGKALFGGGAFISQRLVQELKLQELKLQEIFELSPREEKIVKRLDENYNNKIQK